MNNTAPTPRDCSAEALTGLVRQIVQLTPEQQRRLTDVALGMYLQKEAADTNKRKEA